MVNLKKMVPRSIGYLLRKLKLNLRGLANRGSKYYCPYCDQSYRRMFDGGFDLPVIKEMKIIGAGRRTSIICPGCASTDRDRLLWLYFNRQLELAEGMRILHIAPEPAIADFFSEQKHLDYNAGVKYHEGFYYSNDIQLFDIINIPYPEGSFHLVICNHVLEHIDEDEKAMKEILRVLKPNGKAVLQVPWSPCIEKTYENKAIIAPEEREKAFGQFDHVRLYGRDYPKKLEKAGFFVHKIMPKELTKNNSEAELFAINPNEVIFVGEKQT